MPSSPPSERSPKRRRSSSPLKGIENVIEISPTGGALLVLKELAGVKPVTLQLSQDVLEATSTIFASMLQNARLPEEPKAHEVLMYADEEDDVETLYLLCNILHLRNDKLPSRLSVDALCSLAKMVQKYKCATAVSRATMGWFDRLYSAAKAGTVVVDVWKMVEAAYLLDEPVFFARFTEMWVLEEPLAVNSLAAAVRTADDSSKRLAVELHNRRQAQTVALKSDVDLLVNPCSVAFSKSARHYTDYAPGMMPDPDDDGRTTGSICHVDEQAGALVSTIQAFRIPEYDDCDKCEFCEDVKTAFGTAVDLVKKMHKERLWGLCLDCFKAGGINAGECRYEHSKARIK
ncbi:hypothetical protein LTR10_005814 [Elasticomyces elasticus]|nr:hypothetical protein LTR10_005814 [Elasticomyces elasticus]KAK4965021.1 hypothetical protein LTR42_012439 [Elasticomyces elasticus]